MVSDGDSAMTTASEPTRRKNLYKGTMTGAEAREKLSRTAKRVGLGKLEVSRCDGEGAKVAFTFKGARVERSCDTQPTFDANIACLALWLEDRARNIERAIETFAEAFADSMALAVVGAGAESDAGDTKKGLYTGTRTIEQSIEVFRSGLSRLGIPEGDVKLTWDGEANNARLRMRLPSGSIVEKVSKRQVNAEANVAALALWLQSRTKNWERGIESMDLDRVFAGNLLPARVA
jgi:hypothetical protein